MNSVTDLSLVTVLGATGFIGSRLVQRLAAQGIPCVMPKRDESLTNRSLGTVFYCVGLTADFRTKPFETVEAHVCKLKHILENCEFDTLIYLSSTRIYSHSLEGREQANLTVVPQDPADLYNLSKLMGESLALHSARPCRIARLSNVYGDDFESDNFLTSIIRDAVTQGSIVLRSSLASAKDYISVDKVITLLLQIAVGGKAKIYNVASGVNTTNGMLLDSLAQLTGTSIEIEPDAPTFFFPPITVEAIREEFGATPSDVVADLAQLLPLFVRHFARTDLLEELRHG